MEENRKSDRVKNALCFVPFFPIFIYVVEKKETDRISKNLFYAVCLFILFILLWIIFRSFWLALLLYLWISWFFWYKSYNWEDLDIDFLDNFLDKYKK